MGDQDLIGPEPADSLALRTRDGQQYVGRLDLVAGGDLRSGLDVGVVGETGLLAGPGLDHDLDPVPAGE